MGEFPPPANRGRPCPSPDHAGLSTSVLSVLALVFASLLVAVSPTASQATGVRGSLAVISVADQGTGLAGAVAARPFTVVVEARTRYGAPLVLTQDTRVRLSLVTRDGQAGRCPRGRDRQAARAGAR